MKILRDLSFAQIAVGSLLFFGFIVPAYEVYILPTLVILSIGLICIGLAIKDIVKTKIEIEQEINRDMTGNIIVLYSCIFAGCLIVTLIGALTGF